MCAALHACACMIAHQLCKIRSSVDRCMSLVWIAWGTHLGALILIACTCTHLQLVDELLAFWTLEDYEDTLEELEEALIVSTPCMPH